MLYANFELTTLKNGFDMRYRWPLHLLANNLHNILPESMHSLSWSHHMHCLQCQLFTVKE